MSKEIIQDITAVCQHVIFQKDGFMIASFWVEQAPESSGLVYGTRISVKGNYVVHPNEQVILDLKHGGDERYPNTYRLAKFRKFGDKPFEMTNENIYAYLLNITSEKRAQAILDKLPDPVKVFEDRDILSLCQIPGIKEHTANVLVNNYHANLHLAEGHVVLSDFGLSDIRMNQLLSLYDNNVEELKYVLQNNPYKLSAHSGFGFKTCDTIYLNVHPNGHNDQVRVNAYLRFMFEEEFSKGNTWLSPREVVDKIREFIPGASLENAVNEINEHADFCSLTVDGKKRLSLTKFYRIEDSIAENLHRLKSRDIKPLNNIPKHIQSTEEEIGFKFSDDQIDAIYAMLKSKVFLLQGVAGAGKTSVVRAVANAYNRNGLKIAQCSLSGKAADNLRKVTGYYSSTIHSLLRYGTPNQYNAANKLPYDVVIVDEISMVDITIFNALIKAMNNDAILIMMGDEGQLDSIGAGVMNGLITSPHIDGLTLTKIHRQAESSAIISHSFAYRNGLAPKGLKMAADTTSDYGAQKDMRYTFVDDYDEGAIASHAVLAFAKSVQQYGLDDSQILCSVKKIGNVSVESLNKQAQALTNPPDNSKFEYPKPNSDIIFREGDKVINTRNNKEIGIYNGNTGTISSITDEGIYIDFHGIGSRLLKFGKDNAQIQAIDLGYAITIHKAQGSTIKSVIIAMPFNYMLTSRELIYTAITRASKQCYVITSQRTIKFGIHQTSKQSRNTNLDYLLEQASHYEENSRFNMNNGLFSIA